MSEFTCPKGHLSTDNDFCSECGIAMSNSINSNASLVEFNSMTMDNTSFIECPECGTPRVNENARYCENCRYDFVEHRSYRPVTPKVEIVAISGADSIDGIKKEVGSPSIARDINIVSSVDMSRVTSEIPQNLSDKIYRLQSSITQIGRKYDKDTTSSVIALSDPGVSKKHAQIHCGIDGMLAIIDLGSTNGTKLNGNDLKANVLSPLAIGDIISLGCWTNLTIIRDF
jgi:pSer/pThr/pTyr-binding forkhead associated (FHA) protein